MGIFSKFFRRNRKSFDELMEEHYNVSKDYLAGRVDEKTLLERQRRILKEATKAAKDDKQKLTVNASIIELKKREEAVRAGIVRR